MKKYRVMYVTGVAGKITYSDPMSYAAARQYALKVSTWPNVMAAGVERFHGQGQQAQEGPEREAG